MFRGGYEEGKSRVILHFFYKTFIWDCECNADRHLWGNAPAWMLHTSISVYGREHIALGRHVDGDTKC